MTLTQRSLSRFACCMLVLSLSACDVKDVSQPKNPAQQSTAVSKPAPTVSTEQTHAALHSPKKYQCQYEKRFKDGGSIGAKVELEIVQEKINKLVVYSLISSGEEGGGYLCGIDTSDKGQTVEWSEVGKNTILSVDQSIIEIEHFGQTYKIKLENASREACGFGAEWPEYVIIEPGNSKCRIKN